MIGWFVAAWFFGTGCYWVLRARKAERRAAMWQDECRRAIQAQAEAEVRAMDATALLGRVQAAYQARIEQDPVNTTIAHQARRLH